MTAIELAWRALTAGLFHPDLTIVLLVLCCAAILSVIGLGFALFFETLLFLDTLGTAVVALSFGGLWGLVFGCVTNLITAKCLNVPAFSRFFYVNGICGILWGALGAWLVSANGLASELSFVTTVLIMGAVVGLVSGLIATGIRCRGAKSDHILDQIRDQLRGKGHGFSLLALIEFLVSHFPDKAITSAVALLLVMLFAGSHRTNGTLTHYEDTIEIFAALYYVTLGVVIKKMHVSLFKSGAAGGSTDDAARATATQESLLALLGPLGFFGLLSALPAVLGLHTW